MEEKWSLFSKTLLESSMLICLPDWRGESFQVNCWVLIFVVMYANKNWKSVFSWNTEVMLDKQQSNLFIYLFTYFCAALLAQ
jgi:hypothetical protein